MQDINKIIDSIASLGTKAQSKILLTIAIILSFWLIRLVIIRIVQKNVEDIRIRYTWRKSITYAIFFIGLMLIGRVWFQGVRSVATFLGLLSAGIAIALKDIISNLAGWAFIILKRPFAVGDRIQIGSHAGDVIDVRPFQFTLMEIGNWVQADQSTGRIIHVPNGVVLSQPLSNYNKGFQHIWNEIGVLITFESDWKKTKSLLQEIANKHAEHAEEPAKKAVRDATNRFLILYRNLTPTVYTSVKESGVLLTIRYLCIPKHRRVTEEAIWEDVLNAFEQNDNIEFAYPTTRFFRPDPALKAKNSGSPEI